jgi:hypothetical protein
MASSRNTPFVPVLTVMAEYGNAPFLWIVDNPDEGGVGGNLCDGTHWDESLPMSEGLWHKFADWAIEFDRTAFYSDSFDADGWNWVAFNARGLQLSRWLKEEVGNAYRVVYDKPVEDPNHRIDGRTEILADGSLLPLRGALAEPIRFCEQVVSGGQTGADRAALDVAIAMGMDHGGWCPQSRKAEDGVIPDRYKLKETPKRYAAQRTEWNVRDSDGTLILNIGVLDGGSLNTAVFAKKHEKPCLVVQLDLSPNLKDGYSWLLEHGIKTLNVAGPRESKRPGIYQCSYDYLQRLLQMKYGGSNDADGTSFFTSWTVHCSGG